MATIDRNTFFQQMKDQCALHDREGLFNDVLKACKFPENKENFSDSDKEYFLLAKSLIDNGNSIDNVSKEITSKRAEVAKAGKQKNNKSVNENRNDNSTDDPQLDDLGSLNDSTIKLAAEMGTKQAEIFSKAVQAFTLKRLNEMIKNGEMNQGIKQIWQESMNQLGKPEVLQQKIDTIWENRQKQIYSLPPEQIISSKDEDEEQNPANIVTVETIPNSETTSQAPIELANLINQLVQQQMIIVIQQEQTYIKLEKEKLVLQTTKKEKRLKAIKQWAQFINSWTWVVILIVVVFFLGLHTGINLITKGVICQSRVSLCYFLRFDNNKKSLE